MTARPWMPFYVRDFLADTQHLDEREIGVYVLLILHYWQNDGLPNDDKKLARICRVAPRTWAKFRPTISEFFQPGWKHKRIDAEIAKAEKNIQKRKEAAGKRWSKSNANASEVDMQCISPAQSHTDTASAVRTREAVQADYDRKVREYLDAVGQFATASPASLDISPLTALESRGYDWPSIMTVIRGVVPRLKKLVRPSYFVPIVIEHFSIPEKPKPEKVEPTEWINTDDPRWPKVSKGRKPMPTKEYPGEKGLHIPLSELGVSG